MLCCSAKVAPSFCYRHRLPPTLHHEITSCLFGAVRCKYVRAIVQQMRTVRTHHCIVSPLTRTCLSTKYTLNQFSKNIKLSRECFIANQKRSTAFLLELVPLSVFSQRRKCRRTLSPVVLAAIPKEVFTKEAMFTTELPHSMFMRFLASIWDVVMFAMRFVHVVIVFLPLLCLLPMTYLSESCMVVWREALLVTVQHMGPTFIKLGQWASTRRDMFSPEFCNLFSKLHTRAAEHSWSVSQGNLDKAFGDRWSDVLLMMEERPIGSGCIAQVTYL